MKINIPLPAIVLGAVIGLAVGVFLEYASEGEALGVFLISATLAGIIIGALIEFIRHRWAVGRAASSSICPALKDLPADTVEFVERIIGKMRYRRKVRDDVMAELAAHFQDALKDCKTNEEKQQKARQLVTDFGDVKLLAVLLRRAKKRCRPLWRTVIARTAQAIVILFACFVVYLVWFLTGKPVITTNFVAQLNQLVHPAVDESLNAAPLYKKAVDLYKKPSDRFLLFFADNYEQISDGSVFRDKRLAEQIRDLLAGDKEPDPNQDPQELREEVVDRMTDLLASKYHELKPQQKNFIAKWIQEQKEALDIVNQGSQKPYYWHQYQSPPEDDTMFSILLPHLSPFRNLVMALRCRAHLSAEQGSYEDAFEDIKSCYRFGQHVKAKGLLIEQLVGIAIEAVAVQTLTDIIHDHEIDSARLTALQRDLEQTIAGEDFTITFEAERLFAYDAVQMCFTEDRFGSGHLYIPLVRNLSGSDSSDGFGKLISDAISRKALKGAVQILFLHPGKQQTRRTAEHLYDYCEQVAAKTPAQLRAEGINIEEQAMKIADRNILLNILMPAVDKIIELSCRNKAAAQAAVTVLALLRYQKDNALYPENLHELVTAGYLKNLPPDPYTDKPLVYRKTEDGFLLYSVAGNLQDDRGLVGRDHDGKAQKWPDQDAGDAVFWPVPKPEKPRPGERRPQKRNRTGK